MISAISVSSLLSAYNYICGEDIVGTALLSYLLNKLDTIEYFKT